MFEGPEIEEFKAEAFEMLDGAEQTLLGMSTAEGFAAGYNSVFRIFHSLKGAAGMVELQALQDHMHRLEEMFGACRSAGTFAPGYLDLFLRGVDGGREILRTFAPIDFNYDAVPVANPAGSSIAPVPPAAPGAESAAAHPHPDAASPVAPVIPLAPARTPAQAAPGAKRKSRVLIVDDESGIVDYLTEFLADSDFEARGTTSPEEGLRIAREFRPDVIVSDLMMPGMDGLQFLRHVREFNIYVPVIFLSGHIDMQVLLDGLLDGIAGAFQKPVSAKRLRDACRTAAHRYRLLQLINQSINLLIYQFSDLDRMLEAEGRAEMRESLRDQIAELLDQRRELTESVRKRA